MGAPLTARYKMITLRLHRGDAEESPYENWSAPIGFVDGWHSDGLILLGSIGFLDRFTVTASRFAQAVAIEDREAFDGRFGIVN